MLIMAAVNGFFSGRGRTWTVLVVEAFGTAVNVALALVLIFGRLGFPAARNQRRRDGPRRSAHADVGPAWLWSSCCDPNTGVEFNTLRGWRPEHILFNRLMVYGGARPGLQVCLDVLVFHVFVAACGKAG